ncbi:glutamyl/glutaminyl-tRNA synthetase [Kipferlia bialata]|uniref:Glutamyl/glutaminyl-tRNA synthetase n=1 Tax=Kipferlia bialata TaxID=797122 RepID=A0A9K3GN66_9EUKA|nr:glutamyl/glutaminyl-tRNA synthetase [Kipferlia bialata]|eukprot:g11238.t1
MAKKKQTPSPVLRFCGSHVPHAVVLAGSFKAKKMSFEIVDEDILPQLIELNGDVIVGQMAIVSHFFGNVTPADMMWYEFCSSRIMPLTRGDFPSPHVPNIAVSLRPVNQELALRQCLNGASLSASDFLLYGALVSIGSFTKICRRNLNPHLFRWFDYMAGLPCARAAAGSLKGAVASFEKQKVAAQVAAAKAASDKAAAKGKGKQTSKKEAGDNEALTGATLEGAVMGQVCTRFPPEPSGYLHIGHVKACLLNHFYATKYQGKMHFRLDDTNPAKESPEFVDNIKRDMLTLGVDWQSFSHTSDHFALIQGKAEALIKEGKAFVDDTDVETMREQRLARVESSKRYR